MVGYAFQRGLIPLSEAAILKAIELNAQAVESNTRSFNWGRLAAVDPAKVAAAAVPASMRPDSQRLSASVNEMIVHGIPDGYRLRAGDLVSIDCGASLDGFHGDSAITFTVGAPGDGDAELIKFTWDALAAAIAVARVGGRLGDVSHAVGQVGRAAGYGIPAGFGGHGVGRQMHEDPSVPNEGQPGRGMPLRAGLVIAIEPMFMAGGRDEFVTARDGWALRTADGSRAAHFEHTIAVTEDGPLVLTAL
jgi:methionyl aminopeptidase